jgi:HEAT repeat protein
MGRPRRKLLILLICAIAVVLFLVVWREREPSYQGRLLSDWLQLVNPTGSGLSAESQVAIRHIGSKGVPFLVKWMQLKPVQDRPGKMQMRLVILCFKLPRPLAEPLIRRLVIVDRYQLRYTACEALCELGPDARSAIPELSHLIETPNSAIALRVLAHIGDDGVPPILAVVTNRASPHRAEAIAVLASPEMKYTFNQTIISALMSCLDDSDFDVAFDAADVLCAHHIAPELVIFPLIRALERDDQLERRRVLGSLHAAFARNFSMASLLQFLQDTNSPYSSFAAGALGQVARREIILPALTNSLHDPRLPVRRAAVSALDLLESAAEPAVPALLDAWNDPDYKMRLLATNAICDMPAYAVLRDINSLSGEEALSQSEKISFFRGVHGYTPGPRITPLLNHPDIRIREMATNASQKLSENNSQNQTSQAPAH